MLMWAISKPIISQQIQKIKKKIIINNGTQILTESLYRFRKFRNMPLHELNKTIKKNGYSTLQLSKTGFEWNFWFESHPDRVQQVRLKARNNFYLRFSTILNAVLSWIFPPFKIFIYGGKQFIKWNIAFFRGFAQPTELQV